MAKKDNEKKSEVALKVGDFVLENDVVLKAGDVLITSGGKKIELDEAQAASLNQQISDNKAGNSNENSTLLTSKKIDNLKKASQKGTPRFNKLNKK